MTIHQGLDYCLSDHQLKEMIQHGRLITDLDHAIRTKRIQPDSFEPILDSAAFLLKNGAFSAAGDQSIYRTICEAKPSERAIVDLEKEPLRPGKSYLVKLVESVRLDGDELVKFSPKSSSGRTFMGCRLFADYTPGRELVRALDEPREMDLWLLLEPPKFECQLAPGLTLSQLRILSGPNAALTPGEILAEHMKTPLMYIKGQDGENLPARLMRTDTGVELCLDLNGWWSEGIAGLRAKDNAPILDFTKREAHRVTDFFDPFVAEDEKINGESGDCFLFASHQVLKCPKHLNAELDEHFARAFEGTSHKAGFVDPGFLGQLVFEATLTSRAMFMHGMPMGNLRWFRNGLPDDEYGSSEAGSHYKGQLGPRVAKYFVPPNWKMLAKRYETLDQMVLVQDPQLLDNHHSMPEEFSFITDKQASGLYNTIEQGFFHSRYDCEGDSLVQQVVPYLVIFGPDQTVWRYVRADKLEKSGAEELHGKISIGVGGHMNKYDCNGEALEWMLNCMHRKALSQEVLIEGEYTRPRLLGTIVASDNPRIDPFHFGVVYATYTDGNVVPVGDGIVEGSFVDYTQLTTEFTQGESQVMPEFPRLNAETWTRKLIPHLHALWLRTVPDP